jgi:hypothetical protein
MFRIQNNDGEWHISLSCHYSLVSIDPMQKLNHFVIFIFNDC